MKSFQFIINILFCCHIWICFTYNEEKEQNSKQTLEQRFKDQNYGEVYLKRESNSLMKNNMSQYERNKKTSKANKLKGLRIKSKELNASGVEENQNRNEDKSDVSFKKFVLNFGFLLLFIISSFVVSVVTVMIGTQYFKSWFSLCFNFHSIFCFYIKLKFLMIYKMFLEREKLIESILEQQNKQNKSNKTKESVDKTNELTENQKE
jgi:hypothetical protein